MQLEDEQKKWLELGLVSKVIDFLPARIFWKSKEGVYLGCNESFAHSINLESSSCVIGKTDYDLPVKKEDSDSYRKDDMEVMALKKEKINIEEQQTLADGRVIFLLTSKVPFLDERGDVLGIIGMYHDITELRLSKDRAEIANKAKSEFIANMSHDLRTPMTGLLGMLDGLLYAEVDARVALAGKESLTFSRLEGVLTDMLDKVKKYAGIARDSASSLNKLHNDILDNVELESGESKEVAAGFYLDELVQSVIGLQRPVAEDKRIKLVAEINKNVPCRLKGLRQSLNRVLLNLISNALKFTAEGEVSVKIDLADDSLGQPFQVGDVVGLEMQVKDTGIGIPDSKFNKIYERFSRLTSSYQGQYKGLGLGLYVVKQYVEAMQGKIAVKSQVGKGTCFTLSLPFVVDEASASEYFKLANQPKAKNSGNTEEVAGESTLPVLLVEDDKIAAMAVRVNLSKLGCQVEWVGSGEAALEKAAANEYRLILMDIGLPKKSGIEAAREMRALPDLEKANVPIVALTGHARGRMRSVCLEAGMQSVIAKPADMDDLRKMIEYFG